MSDSPNRTISALASDRRVARIEQLEQLISNVPQFDETGSLRYLLVAGVAVDLLTGYERDHGDLDFVKMSREHLIPELRDEGVQALIPSTLLGGSTPLDPAFLAETRVFVPTRRQPEAPVVACIHPGILLVQKVAVYHGMKKRPIDHEDTRALKDHLLRLQPQGWPYIANIALATLRPQARQAAVERLSELFEESWLEG